MRKLLKIYILAKNCYGLQKDSMYFMDAMLFKTQDLFSTICT